jgi:hypothetical protein
MECRAPFSEETQAIVVGRDQPASFIRLPIDPGGRRFPCVTLGRAAVIPEAASLVGFLRMPICRHSRTVADAPTASTCDPRAGNQSVDL